MLGDVWEWTASDFRGYDGFAHREELVVGGELIVHPNAWKRKSVTSAPSSAPLATSEAE